MRRIYLAAPLSAPTRKGVAANRTLAASWAAWISKTFKVAVSADWIWLSGVLSETEENRRWGLACDCVHVASCQELWMVGAHISSGMLHEMEFAKSVNVPVFNLCGAVRHEALVRKLLADQGWKEAA